MSPKRPERGKDESLKRPEVTTKNRNTQPDEREMKNDRVCRCGRMFKNSRGVKIHQAKTKCLEKQQQRTARNSEAGEAEEVKGPESNHSAQDHQATDDGNEQRRDRINWPSNKLFLEMYVPSG